MEQTNKAAVRRWYEEIFNQGNLAVIDELVAPDVVTHAPGVTPLSAGTGRLDRLKQIVNLQRTTWPDHHYTIEDQIAEGDKVVTRWTQHGTQKGEMPNSPFGAIAPTGKEVTITGITIHRLVNGKIVEIWRSADSLGLFQQLGVIPQNPSAAARS